METNIYETVVIFSTKPKADTIENIIKDYVDIMQGYSKPKKAEVDVKGERSLAYEIKDNKEGYFVVFTWQGTIEQVHELERLFRIDDDVLKFLTVKNIDVELEDYAEEENKSEQRPSQQIDALDVLLGLAKYE